MVCCDYPVYTQLWFWLIVLGILFLIIGAIVWTKQTLLANSWWIWFLIGGGAILVIIGFFVAIWQWYNRGEDDTTCDEPMMIVSEEEEPRVRFESPVMERYISAERKRIIRESPPPTQRVMTTEVIPVIEPIPERVIPMPISERVVVGQTLPERVVVGQTLPERVVMAEPIPEPTLPPIRRRNNIPGVPPIRQRRAPRDIITTREEVEIPVVESTVQPRRLGRRTMDTPF